MRAVSPFRVPTSTVLIVCYKCRYADVLPMHRRWLEYLQQTTVAAANLKEVQERLYNIDLHGCMLRVAESANEWHAGLSGVVVRDSKTALLLVTPDDRLVLVPKKSSVFEYQLDQRRAVVLLGSGLVPREGRSGANGAGR